MNLRLNSISDDLFSVKAEDERALNCNGIAISREDLVARGRLVACEYIGKRLDARECGQDKYISRLSGKAEYSNFAKDFADKKFMYCATMANKAVGKEAPASVEDAKKDYSYAYNKTFLATMAAIDNDVITPILFKVFDDISAGGFMTWEPVTFGGTKLVDIRSNDVFLFEDSSWGSARSAGYNELYGKTISLNPTPYVCAAKIKWYQNVVNGDPGSYYASIIGGMWNKIYAILIDKVKSVVGNTQYIPSGYTASGYSDSNFFTITNKVAAFNGVRRSDLVVFGTAQVLSHIYPAIAGLQYGLGEEWFRRGYLPVKAGVQLLEIEPVGVPGTQNTTADLIDTGDNLFVAAKAGYAPFIGGYYDGTPITLEMNPSETMDMTIDLNTTATFDIKPAFASKVGVITSVS